MDTINKIAKLSLREAFELMMSIAPEFTETIWKHNESLLDAFYELAKNRGALKNLKEWRHIDSWYLVEHMSYEIEEKEFLNWVFNSDVWPDQAILVSTMTGEFKNCVHIVPASQLLNFALDYDNYISKPGEPFIQASYYAFVMLKSKRIIFVHDEGYVGDFFWE